MPVYRLEQDRIIFPNPSLAEDNGLLAVGGDLSVDRLLLAYSHGIFPWYNPGEDILWWCPRERFLIFPDQIHVSHSMKKYMKKHTLKIVVNRDFQDTMHRCRIKRENEEGSWIGDDIEAAYLEFYKAGYGASVEAYEDDELAGGLYGVVLGKCFFGESMFSERENGSKAALIGLSRILEKRGFLFIDCQFHTDHLESMGGQYVSWKRFEMLLQEGLGQGH